ncbi:hypothetical protein KMB83_gp09 [Ralstonia phage Anchaing]|uniref:Uncharacterized protein n=1 Tax=Ralstonia phage Anchaing TaxID=2759719 RepID=A0A7G5B8A6_9CAUD|nr:hypothetical protein KMB83_gp09 [Ralstonia phage Anchaing]QMV32529.1 hypothetical protein A1_00009 [Ralstonia phage Anchaing]
MTLNDVLRAFESLGSDEDEFLPAYEAMTTLARLMVDESMPQATRLALLDVGATLWRLGLHERHRPT